MASPRYLRYVATLPLCKCGCGMHVTRRNYEYRDHHSPVGVWNNAEYRAAGEARLRAQAPRAGASFRAKYRDDSAFRARHDAHLHSLQHDPEITRRRTRHSADIMRANWKNPDFVHKVKRGVAEGQRRARLSPAYQEHQRALSLERVRSGVLGPKTFKCGPCQSCGKWLRSSWEFSFAAWAHAQFDEVGEA